jgi:hypothetical protein
LLQERVATLGVVMGQREVQVRLMVVCVVNFLGGG